MIFGNVANVVQAERVILIAEIELKVVVTVVVVDGHAHLKHLRLVLFQIGLHVHGIVTGHHVHSLHPFLVRFVSVQRNGREREWGKFVSELESRSSERERYERTAS